MDELKILKGKRGKIFNAVMNAIIPQGGPFKAGAADYDLLPMAEKYLKTFDSRTSKLFPVIFWYIELWSIIHTGKRFTKLSTERAGQFLEGMETSIFYHNRGMLMLLKLFTTLTFFDIDEVAEQIGYSHGCHIKKSARGGK